MILERDFRVEGKTMRHSFLVTAWILWLLAHAARLIFSPVLPLIEDELGISHAQAGRFFIFLTIGYCGSLFSVPFWSRTFGYRRTLEIALVILTVTLLLMRWAPGVAAISAVAFGIGLATGTILPSAISLLTTAYRKEQWGMRIAVFDSAAPAGQLVAPMLAVAVLSAFSWRYVFWAMAAVSVLVLGMVFATAPEEEPAADQPRGSIAVVRKSRSLVTLTGLWILASAASLGVGFLVPVYLVKERGMTLTAANQIFATGRGLSILAAVSAGFLADRFTCRSLLGWILAVSGVGLFGIALWPENVGVGIWVIVEGLVANMFFPVGLILIARLTAAGVRGVATGLVIGAGAALGFGVTPWVLGAVADVWNFRAGIAVLGGMVLLASLAVRRIERL
ncbi:MAG: MFS transporter [Nitrospinota bacterium]